jgi:hypothetical protein
MKMKAVLKEITNNVQLKTEEKVDANTTFFTTIIGPSKLENKTVVPNKLLFWKKPVDQERVIPGEQWYNFLYPNTSFQCVHYDNQTIEIEVLGIQYPIKDEHIGAEDCVVIIDVTDEPYITRAGQVISLGYHTLRFTLNYATIVSKNKFRCSFEDFKVNVGVPQR